MVQRNETRQVGRRRCSWEVDAGEESTEVEGMKRKGKEHGGLWREKG